MNNTENSYPEVLGTLGSAYVNATDWDMLSHLGIQMTISQSVVISSHIGQLIVWNFT